jgi:hypothetical protein
MKGLPMATAKPTSTAKKAPAEKIVEPEVATAEVVEEVAVEAIEEPTVAPEPVVETVPVEEAPIEVVEEPVEALEAPVEAASDKPVPFVGDLRLFHGAQYGQRLTSRVV